MDDQQKTPVGHGKKYAWLQTPKGREYTKRHNANGAERTAKYRERHRETYLVSHREQERARRATPKAKRSKKNAALMKAYGITVEQFEAMAEAQAGLCGICAKKLDMGFNTHVDHCHETGAVRGILCNGCNVALGLFQDSADMLARAVSYLKGEFKCR